MPYLVQESQKSNYLFIFPTLIMSVDAETPVEPQEDAPVRQPMDFAMALNNLKLGHKIARSGWNGKGMHIAIQSPDEHSANTLPYIYMITVTGDRVPWLASQTDLLSNDWVLV